MRRLNQQHQDYITNITNDNIKIIFNNANGNIKIVLQINCNPLTPPQAIQQIQLTKLNFAISHHKIKMQVRMI